MWIFNIMNIASFINGKIHENNFTPPSFNLDFNHEGALIGSYFTLRKPSNQSEMRPNYLSQS